MSTTVVTPTGAFATTLGAAQAAALATAEQQVVNFNAVLNTQFAADFAEWAENAVKHGSVTNPAPPQPPKSYVVAYATDPTTVSAPGEPDVVGPFHNLQWPYPSQAGPAICAMPTLPVIAPVVTGTMLVGKRIYNEWFNAQTGDATLGGTTAPATSQDGVSGLFEKYTAPVGQGWFKLIG